MHLLLVRHGQSRWQVEGEVAGMDPPLTPLGELQSGRLGRYLARTYAVDAIFASPLKRAHQTAEIVGESLGLPVALVPDLCEYDEWEGGWAPYPVSMWDATPALPVLKPAYARFRQRVLAALQAIVAARHEDSTLLIVAHGGSLGVVLRVLFGSDTPRLMLRNAAVNVLEWGGHPDRGHAWILHFFNQMEYLPSFMRTY